MEHPTIWGHNCAWYHHIFNFFILNTLSIISRILLFALDWRIFYNRMYFCMKYKNIIRPTKSIDNIMKNHKNMICARSHTSIWDSIIIMLYIFREKIPTLGAAKYELFWVRSGISYAILDLFLFIGIRRWIPLVKLLNLLSTTMPRTTKIYF